MPRGQARSKDEMAVSPLAARLLAWADEHGKSLRAMSLAAGLAPDALRNLTRKADFRPTARTLEAFSRLMGVPVESLMHPERPLPPPAAPAKAYRTFAPTPRPVEEVFEKEELAIMAALGIEVQPGPKVLVPDPETGDRMNLVPPWYSSDAVREAVLEHVELAAAALRRAMKPE